MELDLKENLQQICRDSQFFKAVLFDEDDTEYIVTEGIMSQFDDLLNEKPNLNLLRYVYFNQMNNITEVDALNLIKILHRYDFGQFYDMVLFYILKFSNCNSRLLLLFPYNPYRFNNEFFTNIATRQDLPSFNLDSGYLYTLFILSFVLNKIDLFSFFIGRDIIDLENNEDGLEYVIELVKFDNNIEVSHLNFFFEDILDRDSNKIVFLRNVFSSFFESNRYDILNWFFAKSQIFINDGHSNINKTIDEEKWFEFSRKVDINYFVSVASTFTIDFFLLTSFVKILILEGDSQRLDAFLNSCGFDFSLSDIDALLQRMSVTIKGILPLLKSIEENCFYYKEDEFISILFNKPDFFQRVISYTKENEVFDWMLERIKAYGCKWKFYILDSKYFYKPYAKIFYENGFLSEVEYLYGINEGIVSYQSVNGKNIINWISSLKDIDEEISITCRIIKKSSQIARMFE